jgi:hypothetical protein
MAVQSDIKTVKATGVFCRPWCAAHDLPSAEMLRAELDQSGYAVIHSLVDDEACAALARGSW